MYFESLRVGWASLGSRGNAELASLERCDVQDDARVRVFEE